MSLTSADFVAFYQEVHGHPPFPWQAALAVRVLGEDGWPDLLDLPTGSGKTSALDVALFAMAVDPTRSPRRVVLVVDRRVIVSQAARHAKAIQKALETPPGPVTRAVRAALITLHGDEETPLQVAELRGGTVRDDGWAKRPDVPLLAASTVDQVGSRLLFRGYGVGPLSASIHAGLIGNDTLFLLDEVHLSEPFRQTLQAVAKYFRPAAPGLPERFRVVEMSATAAAPATTVHRLSGEDHTHEELGRRLRASKVARLRVVPTKSADGLTKIAQEATQEAEAMIAAGKRRVLVVMNRVDGARQVAAALNVPEVDLVTGRMRPWDRDEWLSRTADLLQFARAHEGPARVVVATQCVEAGADFDFDGLVTEGASLDALRQRFGRLNRRGRHPAVDAVVLMRADFLKSPEEDPIYGEAAAATWRWLEAQPVVDFGPEELGRTVKALGGEIGALLPARKDAPVLLPGHLDLWARTSHRPAFDPELGPYLHGLDASEPEVTLVWRADLAEGQPPETVAAALAAVPPTTAEGLSLPLRAVRAWLLERAAAPVADLEVRAGEDEEGAERGRPAYRWRFDDDDGGWISADEMESDDVLVVPASYGGLSKSNWDPSSKQAVTDVGDESHALARGRPVRRLKLVAGLELADLDGEAEDFVERVFERVRASTDPMLVALEPTARKYRLIDTGGGWVLRARGRATRGTGDDWSTGQGDRASYLGVEVTLANHLRDVETWARRLATNVGLSTALVDDLALAGLLHDLGKADPRFQALLQGGAALKPTLLAKSLDSGADRKASVRAARRSKYPRGCRHELMSVALVEADELLRSRAHDWDLVLHLVASHHGWCRPFAPAVVDDPPVTVQAEVPGGPVLVESSAHELASLSSPIADRFHRLQRKYGWWGLAWLEALVRLADHRASEAREVKA